MWPSVTGRLRAGGASVPDAPLAEPRQSHQQLLWAHQHHQRRKLASRGTRHHPWWVEWHFIYRNAYQVISVSDMSFVTASAVQVWRVECWFVLCPDHPGQPAGGGEQCGRLSDRQNDEPHEAGGLRWYCKRTVILVKWFSCFVCKYTYSIYTFLSQDTFTWEAKWIFFPWKMYQKWA